MTLTLGQSAINRQRSACQRSYFKHLLIITLTADGRLFSVARF